MRKKLLQFLLVFTLIVQQVPNTFVQAITEEKNVIHNDYITFQSDETPDAKYAQGVDILKEDATLNVSVRIAQQIKEEETLAFRGEKQPGKISVSAVEGYEIESIAIDGSPYDGEAIQFDRSAGMIEKNVIINVKKKEDNANKNPIVEGVKNSTEVEKTDKNTVYPFTPEGANFQITAGSGVATDPYIIDISKADIYLLGDPAVISLKDNDYSDQGRYEYTFANECDYIYEAMLNYGEGYKLLRAYAIKGLVYGNVYKIKDPLEGSSLAYVDKDKLESAVITYENNTYPKPGYIWMIHYNQHSNRVNIDMHYVFDGVENKDMNQTMPVKVGEQEISALGFPLDYKINEVTYHYDKATKDGINGTVVTKIDVTNNKLVLYIHYASEKVNVAFDANGGNFEAYDKEIKTYTLAKGKALSEEVKNPYRKYSDGILSKPYTFLGWFTKSGEAFHKETLYYEDTTYYAKWAKSDALFYIIKKGQTKPIGNENDNANKYLKYGDGYLVDNPIVVHDELEVKKQILQAPSNHDISKESYCKIGNKEIENCSGYQANQYEAVWYRTFYTDNKEWHVDGYIRDLTKVNIEFNLMNVGKDQYDYFTNIDVTTGETLTSWPEGTPDKVVQNEKTYVFSGWYTDAKRTNKASLETIYSQAGQSVKLYGAYEETSDLELRVSNTEVEYDGKFHKLDNIELNIEDSENIDLLYSIDDGKTWQEKAFEYKDANEDGYKIKVKAISKLYGNSKEVDALIKIKKANLRIVANDQKAIYKEEIQPFTAEVQGLIKGDEKTLVYDVFREDESLDAGTYKICVKVENYSNNYQLEVLPGTLTIEKASADLNKVSVEDGKAIYDGKAHGLKSYSSLISSDQGTTFWFTEKEHPTDKDYSAIPPTFTNVGDHIVYVMATNKNYKNTTPIKAHIVITQKDIVITADSISKKFGEKDPDKFSATIEGLVEGDTLTYTVVRETGEDAGKYKLTVTDETVSNNYKVKKVPGVFTIQKAPATENPITVENIQLEYDGKQHAAFKASAKDGSIIEYSLVDSEIASDWKDTPPSRTNAGESIVYVRCVHKNYETSKAVESINITKRKVTIEADNIAQVYGENEKSLSAKILGAVDGEQDLFKFQLSRKAGNAVGSYPIYVTDIKELNNYHIKGIEGTYEIVASDQNKVIVSDQNYTYDGEKHGFEDITTAAQGSTILYSLDNKTFTSKKPQFIEVKDSATVYVKATNPNYKETTAIPAKVTIIPRRMTITSGSATRQYNGEALTCDQYVVSGEGLANEDKITSLTIRGAITNVGTTKNIIEDAIITKDDQDKTDNYNITYMAGSLTINEADAEKNPITVKNIRLEYDGLQHAAFEASAKDGSIIEYSLVKDSKDDSDWSTQLPTIKNVGNLIVYVRARSNNYQISYSEEILNIYQKALTITPKNTVATYGFEKDPKFVADVVGLVEGESISYEVIRTNPCMDAGTYDLTIRKSDSSKDVYKNYDVTLNSGTFTINKALASQNPIEIKNLTKTYNGYEQEAYQATAKAGSEIVYSLSEDGDYSTLLPTRKGKGETTVYVKATHRNYETASSVETLVIKPATITIQPNDITITYGEKEPTLTATVSGIVDDIKPTFELRRESGNDVGSYDIHIEHALASDNYVFELKTGLYKIEKAKASENAIQVKDVIETYNGKAFMAFEATAKSKSTIEYNVVDNRISDEGWTTEKPTRTDAGSTEVYVRAKHHNYETSYSKETIQIGKRDLMIKAIDMSKKYGETDPKLEAKIEGLIDGDKLHFDIVREEGSSVGSYGISINNITISNENYNVIAENGIFKINKASADLNKVNVEDGKATYDGKSHGLTSYSSLVNEGTHFWYTEKKDASDKDWKSGFPEYINAGTYTFYVKATNFNYEDTEPLQAHVVIDKKKVNIKALDNSKKYNEEEPQLMAEVDSLIGKDQATYHLVRDEGNDTGTYVIHVLDAYISDNYEITTIPGIFKIKKASAEYNNIQVKDVNVVYDGQKHIAYQANSQQGGTIQYSLKNSDDDNDWSNELPSLLDVQTITIYVRCLHDNYETSKASEVLQIKKRDAKIIANPTGKTFGVQEDPALTVTIENAVPGEEGLFKYQISREQGEAVKEYPISITNIANLRNYNITAKGALFTISEADGNQVILTTQNPTYVYDGKQHGVGEVSTTAAGSTILYSRDGKTWTDKEFTFKDVTDGEKVYVKATNPNYKDSKVVTVTIQVTPCPITIKAESASKTYDGKALSATGYQVVNGKVVDGETITSIKVEGSILNVGTTTNKISAAEIANQNNSTVKNYSITYVDGTLEITKASAKDNTVSAEKTEAVYDGKHHSIGDIKTSVKSGTVYYSVDNKNWTTEKPTFTNVGDYPVYVQVKDKNYEDSEIFISNVTIAPCPITIKAESASKTYDGKALSATGYQVVNGKVVDGETITSIKVEGSILNVGTTTNKISAAEIADQNNSTVKNYTITYVDGTLEITKAPAKDNTVSASDMDVTYDGNNHTVGKVETTIEDSEVLYSKDGKEWTKEIPSFSEAGTYEVFMKAVNDNYEDSDIFIGKVVINKRRITITANSAVKTFDNIPLTSDGYQLSENGLVKGQNIKVVITGSQTIVGSNANKITSVIMMDGEKDTTANYEIQSIDGTLRVDAAITSNPTIVSNTPTSPAISLIIPPTEVVKELDTPKAEGKKETVKNQKTPKAYDGGNWAFINLLFAGGTLLLGIFLLVNKWKKQEEEGEDKTTYKRKKWLRVASSTIAILSVIMFCLTEDMRLKMILIDKWTLVMAVFFIAQITCFYFLRKWKQENEEPTIVQE